ncbi:hypothetical protein [Acidaminobacter hydrogenoformans]|uniref:Peptidase C39-like domain-containing protein n=1 Tax=Acidaminobacter hydrogenoformans DSM 2784 TaxID=1120920 RepID=A0A1G5RWD9_9FIRM|nr:hypothetical protein [Acidaminobacter hydrogenoformans]SCZ78237.1 hypothetical protein SAMN03080599_01171 [Acidaminobacter hydrogenoformans DSM 2784]
MIDYSRDLLDKFIGVTSVANNGSMIRLYGGDQAWFETENGRAGGCGTVAAANILAYFGVLYGENTAVPDVGLFTENRCFTRELFIAHMHEVYRGLTPMKAPWQSWVRRGGREVHRRTVLRLPDSLGIHSPVRFSNAVIEMAKGKGVQLRVVWPQNTKGRRPANHAVGLDEAKSFILNQINKGMPVAMLNFGNKGLRGVEYQSAATGRRYSTDRFQWHWVVITGVKAQERFGADGDERPFPVVASSWGNRVILDLNQFWGRGLTHLVSFELV